jgi:exopolysaccharide production protein ExoQ
MPSSIALLLSFGFSFFVYWRDRAREPQMSLALWVPTLWMMRCASRTLSAWFGGTDFPVHYDDGNIYDQVLLGGLMIAGITVLMKRRIDWVDLLSVNKWLIVLFLYMAVSSAWSDYPFLSLKRWIRTVGDLIVVLVVITEDDPLKAIETVFRRTAILLIPLSIVLAKYFPELGRAQEKHWAPDSWIGVATHKNTLGQLLLVSGFYFFWELATRKREMRPSRPIAVSYLLMTAYLLNGGGTSRSTTCILLLLGAVVLYVILQRYKNTPERVAKLLLVGVVCVGMLVMVDDLVLQDTLFSSFVEAQGKDPTLTGRTDLWHDLIPLGMRNPLLGAGFQGFWTPSMTDYLHTLHSWGPSQAHNGYIEIFINLGLTGLALFVFVFLSGFRGAIRTAFSYFRYGQLRIILLIVTLVHNYTESGFARPTHLMWLLFLLVAVSPLNRKQNAGAAETVSDHGRIHLRSARVK